VAVLGALVLILVALPAAAIAQGGGAPTEWARDALAHALAAGDDITDPFHRVQALAEIAEAHAAAGDAPAAREHLERARSFVPNIDGDALRAWARHDVGLAYVKADDLSAAEALAESIPDTRLHDIVLGAVVDARRGARDVPGAQATARRMKDLARQGQSLRTIAILQASEGDLSGALSTARSIQHSGANALALGDVAAAMARDGNFEEARLLVARIRDSVSRSRALVEMVAAQASAGNVKGAVATAAEIDDKLQRAEALARIASTRAAVAPTEAREMFDQALALVSGTRASVYRKCDTLVEIARGQLVAGNPTASTATLKRVVGELGKVKGDTERLNLLSRIAPLQARAGDYTAAFATALRAEDASLRPLLVRDIAVSQAEKGDVAGAVAAARTLDDRPAAAAALFGILRVQSQVQDVSGLNETLGVTLQAVREIGNAELRAGALGSLAAAHAQEGNLELARTVFTEAMNTAAAVDGGQQRAAVYARIADSLADRHRAFAD
jgi:tetratricopeptide (TPR) repeat protein